MYQILNEFYFALFRSYQKIYFNKNEIQKSYEIRQRAIYSIISIQ